MRTRSDLLHRILYTTPKIPKGANVHDPSVAEAARPQTSSVNHLPHSQTLRVTPAMGAGVTDHSGIWRKLWGCYYPLGLPIVRVNGRVKPEIAAYDAVREELEEKHMGKWVVFHDQKLASVHDSFDSAAEQAVRLFGRGPYLIRQVGAPPISLPASVMFKVTHA